jgi:hypothetical protein
MSIKIEKIVERLIGGLAASIANVDMAEPVGTAKVIEPLQISVEPQ